MPIAVDPARSVRYVLLEDRALPPEQQTTFRLKALSAREYAQVEDGASVMLRSGEVRVSTGSKILLTLEIGLVGWENFKDSNKRDVPFDEKDRAKNLEYLAPHWRRELANAIVEETTLTPGDVKN